MVDYIKLAGENISTLAAYKPGKPIGELKREFGLDDIVKLASNENPLGPSEKVKKAIIDKLPEISRYPLGDAFDLRMAVAKYYNVTPDMLLFGSGSNEIIELLLRTFVKAGEHVISPSPSFSVYSIISQAMGSHCEWVPVNPDFSINYDALNAKINDKTRVIFIANPNNPTGTYTNATALKTFLDKLPNNIIVVMDEAYIEFADAKDIPDTLAMLKDYPSLVLMRTFSKAFGLAGLRIGYCIAAKDCCEMMNRVRQPFNSNMLAQVAATVALNDKEWLDKVLTNNLEGRNYIYAEFEKMGLAYVKTQANFILVHVKDGQKIFEELLKKGVIVRFMGGTLKEYIRVSIGAPHENEKFINALKTLV